MSFVENKPKTKKDDYIPDSKLTERDTVRSLMTKGERMILSAKIHGMIYWKSFAVLFIAAWVFTLAEPLGYLLFVTSILMFIYNILRAHFLMLILTNKRILCRYGILQVDVVDMPFDRIESVELERMIPGQIFGYSNVVITGTGNRAVAIPFVANSIQFRKKYNQLTLEENAEEEYAEKAKRSPVSEAPSENEGTPEEIPPKIAEKGNNQSNTPNFILKKDED